MKCNGHKVARFTLLVAYDSDCEIMHSVFSDYILGHYYICQTVY